MALLALNMRAHGFLLFDIGYLIVLPGYLICIFWDIDANSEWRYLIFFLEGIIFYWDNEDT